MEKQFIISQQIKEFYGWITYADIILKIKKQRFFKLRKILAKLFSWPQSIYLIKN